MTVTEITALYATALGCLVGARAVVLRESHTDTGWSARAEASDARPIRLRPSVPIRLRAAGGGSLGLALDFRATLVTVDGSGVATISAYEHRVIDRVGTEALVWHAHPSSAHGGPDHPHLHVSAAVTARSVAGVETSYGLDKVHLPTGPVTLAAVVRMLVEEFGAAGRPGARERLALAERRLAGLTPVG